MKTEVRDIKVGGEVLREAKQRFRAQKPEMPLTNSLLKTKRPLDFEESAVS